MIMPLILSIFQGIKTMRFLQISLFTVLILFVLAATYYLIQIGNLRLSPDKTIRIALKPVGKWLLYLLGIAGFFWVLHQYSSLRYLFNAFITSLVIAYVINPAMKKLENKPYFNRRRAIILIYVIIFLVLLVLIVSILPRTISEFKGLVTKFPGYLEKATNQLGDLSESIFGRDLLNIREKNFTDVLQELNINVQDNMKGLVSGVKTTVSKLFMMILVPIFVYYFLADKEIFIEEAKKWLPKKYKDKILDVGRAIDNRVVQYVKGKILMAVYVGVATGVFLGILRVDFAFVIGLITMIADIIPYLGPLLGLIPAVIFAFIDSPIKALWVLLMYPFLQWTENNLIGPKILSDKLGIHPLFILIAILVGGFLFGFVGMIFALPVIIAAQVLYEELRK
ncbi:MAG: AI-2E family transporter [Tissierellia bacterium]|nr:AI-2E family transporter [Tissierellia bacterium]